MTFKKFSEIFTYDKTVAIKDIANRRVAIDASIKVIQALVGMQYGHRLTGPDGTETSHIKILFANITEFKRCNIHQVWIFDNSIRKTYKINEYEKRSDARDKLWTKIRELEQKILSLRTNKKGYVIDIDTPPSSDDEDDEKKDKTHINDKLINKYEHEINRLKTRNISNFGQAIKDLKFMLDMFQIEYHVAPNNMEAEQIGAWLATEGRIDYFMTTDPDYLLFAAGMRLSGKNKVPISMLKKVAQKSRKSSKPQYDIYTLDSILTEHELSEEELLKVGLCMGVDVISHPDYSIDHGINRIGVQSVIDIVKEKRKSKFYNLKKYHYDGMEIFKTTRLIKLSPMKKTPVSTDNIEQFISWIVTKKGFNIDRVKTSVAAIMSSAI